MEDASGRDTTGCCPHVDRNDHRCGTRFSLGRIEQAFCVCFDSFHSCPMYHRINGEGDESRSKRELVPIVVTANGLPVPLRATGT